MIIVLSYIVTPSKNQNRGLLLRKTGDCPHPGRSTVLSKLGSDLWLANLFELLLGEELSGQRRCSTIRAVRLIKQYTLVSALEGHAQLAALRSHQKAATNPPTDGSP